MLRGAPHPNAARLFINHFLDVESQMTYGEAWMGTTVKNIAERLSDPDAKRFAQVKLLGMITPESRDWAFKIANELFK